MKAVSKKEQNEPECVQSMAPQVVTPLDFADSTEKKKEVVPKAKKVK